MVVPDVPGESLEITDSAGAPAVDPASVHIALGELTTVLDQLRQAKSQLHAVNRLIEKGGDCVDIVTAMVAVSESLDKVAFGVISAGLKQCLSGRPTNGTVDTSSMEKLFLSLA